MKKVSLDIIIVQVLVEDFSSVGEASPQIDLDAFLSPFAEDPLFESVQDHVCLATSRADQGVLRLLVRLGRAPFR